MKSPSSIIRSSLRPFSSRDLIILEFAFRYTQRWDPSGPNKAKAQRKWQNHHFRLKQTPKSMRNHSMRRIICDLSERSSSSRRKPISNRKRWRSQVSPNLPRIHVTFTDLSPPRSFQRAMHILLWKLSWTAASSCF